MDYKEIEKKVANGNFSKKRWYLTEVVFLFTFFTKYVSSAVKKMGVPVPESYCLGEPVFEKLLVKQVYQIFWDLNLTHCSACLASIEISLLNQFSSGQSNQNTKKLKKFVHMLKVTKDNKRYCREKSENDIRIFHYHNQRSRSKSMVAAGH